MLDSPGMGETALALTPDSGQKRCQFTLGNGAKCVSSKVFSRGYCEKHYRSLLRAKAFAPDSLRTFTPRQQVLENVATVRRARRKVLKDAPTYAEHLLAASAIAASKGDSSPAQWALLHTRAIQPITNGVQSNNGVVVNVGVKVQSETEGA